MDKNTELKLYKSVLDFKTNNHIELVQLTIEYNRSFASNKGKITVNLENAVKAWTIADFKQFNDILLMSKNGFNHAEYIHNFLNSVVNSLNNAKSKLNGEYHVKNRKNINVLLNRLIKFNHILVDSFGVAEITAETAPKYKKCKVYSMIMDNNQHKRVIQVFDGYSFVFMGYTFHVYKDEKKNNHVLVPSCGVALNHFKGDIKTSHEYIRELVIHLTRKENQSKLAEIEKEFSALMSDSNFNITYDSIVITELTAEPTKTAENTAKIEKIKSKKATNKTDIRYIIRFNAIYKKRIAKTKTVVNSAKIDFIGYSGKAEKHYNKNVLLALNSSIVPTSNSSVYSALTLSKLNILRGSPFNI